jgi:hypothetical protein
MGTDKEVIALPMHQVRFRATFKQPRLREDQIRVRIPTPIEVEVFAKTRHKWRAREATTRIEYRDMESMDSPRDAQLAIEGMFVEKVTDWKATDLEGSPVKPEGHHWVFV